jgi:hypothetical protein
MRAAHPLHAPAFLVDQDRGITAHQVTQIAGQAAQLVGAVDIAGKQDKAERVRITEKPAFPWRDLQRGWPDNRRRLRHLIDHDRDTFRTFGLQGSAEPAGIVAVGKAAGAQPVPCAAALGADLHDAVAPVHQRAKAGFKPRPFFADIGIDRDRIIAKVGELFEQREASGPMEMRPYRFMDNLIAAYQVSDYAWRSGANG